MASLTPTRWSPMPGHESTANFLLSCGSKIPFSVLSVISLCNFIDLVQATPSSEVVEVSHPRGFRFWEADFRHSSRLISSICLLNFSSQFLFFWQTEGRRLGSTLDPTGSATMKTKQEVRKTPTRKCSKSSSSEKS